MSRTARGAGERLRVAMVVPSLRGGGLERLVRDHVLALDPERYEPAVFCMDGLGVYADDLVRAGIPVRDCTEPRLRIRGLPLRLIRRLRSFRPAVVHAHSGTWLPAAVARTVLRYPRLIFTDHGRYPPEPAVRARIERWCYRRTDAVVAVSSPLADYVRDFLGLDERPLVVPNGIDLRLYRTVDAAARERLRAELGLAAGDVLAICVGRFVPVKNQATLVRALRRAAAAAPTLRLAFVGTGPLEADVRALAAAEGLEDRIAFLGYRSDVPACLAAADLFVLPSTTEGLPVSLLEALASGLPAVASAVGGIPDTLGEPPAGLLVPPTDPAAMADALVRLATDPVLRTELAQRAARRADDFSFDAFLERYDALYAGAAGPRLA